MATATVAFLFLWEFFEVGVGASKHGGVAGVDNGVRHRNVYNGLGLCLFVFGVVALDGGKVDAVFFPENRGNEDASVVWKAGVMKRRVLPLEVPTTSYVL